MKSFNFVLALLLLFVAVVQASKMILVDADEHGHLVALKERGEAAYYSAVTVTETITVNSCVGSATTGTPVSKVTTPVVPVTQTNPPPTSSTPATTAPPSMGTPPPNTEHTIPTYPPITTNTSTSSTPGASTSTGPSTTTTPTHSTNTPTTTTPTPIQSSAASPNHVYGRATKWAAAIGSVVGCFWGTLI